MKKNNKDKYLKIIDGNYWARVTYIDQYGKRRELKRRADNKTHAKQIAQQLLAEIQHYGTGALGSAQMTFADLAKYYEDKYLIEPTYVEDRKVAGLRSYQECKYMLNTLKEYFGNKKIRSITYGDIEGFKLKRLSTETQYKKQRSLASVNRELSLLRRVFNVAHREGWILKTPFFSSDKLISIADEKKRERILSREEEQILLEHCIEERTHLKAIIICALDTGMRQGEIFSLKWRDIDLNKGLINIAALNTKTLQSRQVAITARLKVLLEERQSLLAQLDPNYLDRLVFGIRKSIFVAFDNLRTRSGITDIRFHDLRHTAATRLVQAGLSIQEVGRILGHTQANTTYRYINLTLDTAKRAASALEEFQQKKQEKREEKEGNEPTEYIS